MLRILVLLFLTGCNTITPVSRVEPISKSTYRTNCRVCSWITGACYESPWERLQAEKEWRNK
jgi:hypothetical protein